MLFRKLRGTISGEVSVANPHQSVRLLNASAESCSSNIPPLLPRNISVTVIVVTRVHKHLYSYTKPIDLS
jgi:hypothetical protein